MFVWSGWDSYIINLKKRTHYKVLSDRVKIREIAVQRSITQQKIRICKACVYIDNGRRRSSMFKKKKERKYSFLSISRLSNQSPNCLLLFRVTNNDFFNFKNVKNTSFFMSNTENHISNSCPNTVFLSTGIICTFEINIYTNIMSKDSVLLKV